MNKNEAVNNFIGEFSIVSENKNELYKIIIPLILSRKFFKNSKEKRAFVENILGFSIADYAYTSKTILLGKIINNINELDIQDAFDINEKVTNFIMEVIRANSIVDNENQKNKSSKKQKGVSFFTNWNEYINNNSEFGKKTNIRR